MRSRMRHVLVISHVNVCSSEVKIRG